MLTLFHAPRSRSTRFIFLLEEAGVPYEIKVVNIRRSDGSGAVDPDNPHPLGKVPALVHDDVTVLESSAITLYLKDTFPAAGLGPQAADRTRGAYLSLLSYYGSVEGLLAKGSYLLGKEFSAVDILYWCNVRHVQERSDYASLASHSRICGSRCRAPRLCASTGKGRNELVVVQERGSMDRSQGAPYMLFCFFIFFIRCFW
jgi:glutathione S-transferase